MKRRPLTLAAKFAETEKAIRDEKWPPHIRAIMRSMFYLGAASTFSLQEENFERLGVKPLDPVSDAVAEKQRVFLVGLHEEMKNFVANEMAQIEADPEEGDDETPG